MSISPLLKKGHPSGRVTIRLHFYDDKILALPASINKGVPTRDQFLVAPLSSCEEVACGDCIGVFEREFDYLCSTLRRLGVPPSDIEDLAHEVFLVMYRRWNAYDPAYAIRAWLFGIAFRVAARHRKRLRRETLQPNPEVEDSSPGPEEAAVARQARAIMAAALQQIPLKRRAVFVMHDIDSVVMRDVASILSIPVFTAYSRLRKARKEFEAAVKSIQSGANKR
jgi:RNA polymerase sigma-70 factor (ECF subfamily)